MVSVSAEGAGYGLQSSATWNDARHFRDWSSFLVRFTHLDKTPIAKTAPAPALDRNKLARALFKSDPRVQKFATERGETVTKIPGLLTFNWYAHETMLEKMWNLNEGGWRAEAKARADAVLALLR